MASAQVKMEDIPQVMDRLAKAAEEARERKATQHSFSTNHCPDSIDWPKFRPHMNLDFLPSTPDTHVDPTYAGSVEVLLIDDLLSCFLGKSGQLITPNPLSDPWATRTFTIRKEVDSKLSSLAKKSLEMASYYSIVMSFIQENRKLGVGRVNQAVASALDDFMSCYSSFVIEIECKSRKSNLNLHSLWFLIQPVYIPLKTVSLIVSHIATKHLRGANTLNYLLDYDVTLDHPKSKELCIHLIESAAAPIMLSVQKWIFNGVIYDPFDEFMIVGSPRVQLSKERFPDDYWSKRYQIRNQCTPTFLKCVETTILNAGKYLNVIKDCLEADRNINLAVEEKLVYKYRDKGFLDIIGRAYTHSSKYLLSLMIEEYSILERIKTAKRFLFLQQGDFVIQILDSCEEELGKTIDNCIPSRLQTLVEMAVRLPSTADDEFREDMIMYLKNESLTEQVSKILNPPSSSCEEVEKKIENTLTVLQAFTMTVKCMWPVSLVFNFTAITSYQIIFRHLFYCKYIEKQLTRIWLMDKELRNIEHFGSKSYIKVCALRQKMLHFIQSIEYHMMEEAIEPNWIEYLQAVKSVESIDSLLDLHRTFLNKCLKDCLLTTSLYFQFKKVISTCEEFCNVITSLGSFLELECDVTYFDVIEKLDVQFQEELMAFLNKISDATTSEVNNKLWNIMLRENYNYYFDTNKLALNEPSSR